MEERNNAVLGYAVAVLVVLGIIIYNIRCTTNVSGGSTETTNGKSVAVMYNSDGSRAVHAKVTFVSVSHNPQTGFGKTAVVDSTVTDDTGGYTAQGVAAGVYNILGVGAGNGELSYKDSVPIDTNSILPNDTLKAPGSLRGVVQLQPGDDARTVLILFMGTYTFRIPRDSIGNFTAGNLADGSYHVKILTTTPNYEVLDTNLTVRSGKDSLLPDTIRLKYTGIPVLSGLAIAYDTLKQIVALTWNKPTTGRTIAGYNVYRKRSDSTSFVIIKSGVTDTVHRDSTGVQDQIYEYRVAVLDTNGMEGVQSVGVGVQVVSAFRFVMAFGSPGNGVGQFNEPGEMAFDPQGNLYVLDPYNPPGKVHKFDSQGHIVKTWAPNGAGELRDIEIVNDSILILDRGNKKISIFDTAGILLGEWPILASSNLLNFTVKSQIIYVVDRQNNIILKYSIAGNSLSAWTGIGGNTFKALMGIATNSSTKYLYLMDSDSLGYVADSSGNLISQFRITRSAVAVSHSQWFLLRSGKLIYTGMDRPTIFIIDTNGNMIAKFGTFGSANGQFNWPISVTEFSNRIFISDNNRIQVFDE